jgi:hypothetical protein
MIKRKSFNVQILSIFVFASCAAAGHGVTPPACQSCSRAPIFIPNLAAGCRDFNLAAIGRRQLPRYQAQPAPGRPRARSPCHRHCAAMSHPHAWLQRQTAGRGWAGAARRLGIFPAL